MKTIIHNLDSTLSTFSIQWWNMLEECTRNKIRRLLLFVIVNPPPGYFFPLTFKEWEERETDTQRETLVRDTHRWVAYNMRSNRARGLNLQPRYVPLMGNQIHGPLVCRLTLSSKTLLLFYFGGVGGGSGEGRSYFLKNETISFLGSFLMHYICNFVF